MENQVEEIKKKLDIVSVISKYIPLKKRGRHFAARCPFHAEKTPSFIVSPELQIFKCFGCGKGGDIYRFVGEYDRVDFREALEQLAKEAGVTLIRSLEMSAVEAQRKKIFQLNAEVAKFYGYLLTVHRLGGAALKYLRERQIKNETIRVFQLGYAPANSSLLVNYLQKKGFRENDLIASGTFGKSSFSGKLFDRFADRVVFPLPDTRGRIMCFSGRILPDNPKKDVGKYINSPETEIYHKGEAVYGLHLSKEAIKEAKKAVVVEGEFDLISPFQAGFKNIVAVKGTAFTESQLGLLYRYTDTLILSFDSDFAGSNAAKKSIELADKSGFDIQVLDLEGKYKDPDEAVIREIDFFKQKLEKPIPVWDFLISGAIKTFGVETIKGKKTVLAETLPSIAKINNSVIRADYVKKLAAMIDSSKESVEEEINKYLGKIEAVKTTVAVKKPTVRPRREKLEEYLLTILVKRKKFKNLGRLRSERLRTIAQELIQSKGRFDPAKFQEKLPAEQKIIFQNLYLAAQEVQLTREEITKESRKVKRELKLMDLKEQLAAIRVKLTADEDNEELTSEYQKILGKIAKRQKI